MRPLRVVKTAVSVWIGFSLMLILSSCTLVEDARDQVEPGILILPGSYRLFQVNDHANMIRGKTDAEPVYASYVNEIGWNQDYIAFRIHSTDGEGTEGLINVKSGRVSFWSGKLRLEEIFASNHITDIKLSPVQELIEEKKAKSVKYSSVR